MAALAAGSRNFLNDIPSLVTSFKSVMITKKGPIAPRLSDEEIASIFAYGKDHFEEMSAKDTGVYHVRPSDTGLARGVTWIKTESAGLDFFVHCNKFNEERGGDQRMCPVSGNAEKQLTYAFSSHARMLCVSGAIKCFISSQMNTPFSSRRVSYALNLQRKCAGDGVARISHFGLYPMKEKEREIPRFFSEPPTHKFRFCMELATCDLFESNPSTLTFSQKFDVLYALLTAVKWLHDHGVAHNDLKAENCLLFETWKDLFLTDFGAALKKEDADKDIYQQATPLCLDPESVTGASTDFESLKALDIWQVGLIMSELFDTHATFGLFSGIVAMPSKDQLREMLPTLTPDWYSRKYAARLADKYRDYPDVVGPLINLLDCMLHPERSERPDIDTCISIIEALMGKAKAADSASRE